MQLHRLFSGQLLAVFVYKIIDIIATHLHSHDLSPIHKLVDYRLHCLRLLNVTFDKTLRPKLLPSRSEGSLDNLFPYIFDHFEAGKDLEIIFLICSEICPLAIVGLGLVGTMLIRTHHYVPRIKAK
ncbi:hypothetical protein AVEN_85036-1 [Araneus ventricosus]|uniref:Uncharacterized protein n=1 Tax=Araneus ventricosus TaxID=182803 RepID=A0A4Y2PK04_ARAVE|nr:hypothetical protein AVEN_85036-1 [Araneus ventricosus]